MTVAGKKILSMQGKYPVINLSLKSAKQNNYLTAFKKIRDEIIDEYKRHSYLWDDDIFPINDRKMLENLTIPADDDKLDTDEKKEAEIARYSTSLRKLSRALFQYHNNNVIILLDEYDVPLENAYYAGFYDEMVVFIRSLFESVLKTNNALEFAVVTGCLRISKESIFTGMNNLEINSIRDYSFNEDFGFTEVEVEQMLVNYGIEDKMPEAKKWYDGYTFGDKKIYNPWSIIKYVKGVVVEKKQFPEPYWANTSSNQVIRDMVYGLCF